MLSKNSLVWLELLLMYTSTRYFTKIKFKPIHFLPNTVFSKLALAPVLGYFKVIFNIVGGFSLNSLKRNCWRQVKIYKYTPIVWHLLCNVKEREQWQTQHIWVMPESKIGSLKHAWITTQNNRCQSYDCYVVKIIDPLWNNCFQ